MPKLQKPQPPETDGAFHRKKRNRTVQRCQVGQLRRMGRDIRHS
ncbi:MAG: hypothetical protein ACOX6W_17830 [Lentisphaeria bacterium]